MRILAFRIFFFQEDIPFNGNTKDCQNGFTSGIENHQHDSSTGDTEIYHDTSLARGMESHQDDSVFDDMENHPSNISVGNVRDRPLNAGCLLVIHWQLVPFT